MKKFSLKSMAAKISSASLLMMIALPAFAQSGSGATLGSVADKVQKQYHFFADATTGALMLIGIVVGGVAALKFKAHNENPREVKLATPLTLMLVSALLIGLPAFLNMTKSTVLDGPGNSLDSSVYKSIGG
jgi:intracellular multiplication protein IcmD